jgi:hypothetical protein
MTSLAAVQNFLMTRYAAGTIPWAFVGVPKSLKVQVRTRQFAPKASPVAVAHYERSGCFRLERQLPGGLSSSHWSDAPFSRRTRKLGYRRGYVSICTLIPGFYPESPLTRLSPAAAKLEAAFAELYPPMRRSEPRFRSFDLRSQRSDLRCRSSNLRELRLDQRSRSSKLRFARCRVVYRRRFHGTKYPAATPMRAE